MSSQETPRKKATWGPNPNADYEYVNKYSGRAWPSLAMGIAVFILLTGFAIFRWRQTGQWEATGGQMKMHTLEWLLYKMGGKWLNLSAFCLLGIVGLISGIRTWKKKRALMR
ncbi:hypothetical protein [Chitinophaga japonensis]|uniref:Uncharacterized protein n=1 Tax=Chitinophaga japonensis TaxID=104662 RepID=A0A562T012_CHIJA|nr:hypothetical protein [Chitinophaga japonensis]TWI86628.1 hypothetical protein LX66_3890 [Chitinophaga japonensis]